MKRWYLFMAILGTTIVGYFVVKTYSPINFGAMWNDLVNQARQTTQSDLKSRPDVNDAPMEVLELRRRDQLRPLTQSEEGRRIQDVPHGTYAFSRCGVPSVSAKRDKTLLEIHKHADGIVYYVGYASQDHIDKYFARQKNFHIITSPTSSQKTPLLFEIPVDFIFRCETRPFQEGYLFDLFVTVIPELKE